MNTLDRVTKDCAILTSSDGKQWDVYGSTWEEIKQGAKDIAEIFGISGEIVFNSEMPEA